MTFLTDQGQSIVRNYTVAANARLTVNMETESPLLANAAASTTIVASQPIIVERAMYWPGNGLRVERGAQQLRRHRDGHEVGPGGRARRARTRRSRPTSCWPTRTRRPRRRCA